MTALMPARITTDVSLAARFLREGKLVALPTETVYGLGGNAFDSTAVAKIFAAKQRPHFDPLIVHIGDRAQLGEVAMRIPPLAKTLMDHFWPGPLTLVLRKTERVPPLVTSGLETVAVRMPDHPLMAAVLKETGLPIAAPSANLFGRLSPTTAAHVADQLGNAIELILDGGPCAVGVESTIVYVDEREETTLLRPGGLPMETIAAITGPLRKASYLQGDSAKTPQAPGQLPQHYAPRTPIRIVSEASLQEELRQTSGQRIGLMTLRPVAMATSACDCVEVLSSTGDVVEAAANFFAALHRLDHAGLDVILATPFPEQGLGRALNDRLQRAAHRDSP